MPEYPSINSVLRHRFCSRTRISVYAVTYLVFDSLSSLHYYHGILDMFKGSLEGIPNFWQNMDLPYRHFTPPKPLLSEVIIEQRLHSIPQAPNEPTNPTLEKVNSPIDIIFSKEYNSGDMITDDFTTVEETASLLGFTVQHTRLLIRQGQLKGTKIGREWIIEKESIRTLLSQRNTEPMITERKRGRPPKALIVQRRVS